jgi:glutamate-1-semialdehyde aminotransferase
MPDPSLDSFFFWNSGSEAIEASLKMARQITGRQNIIAMQGKSGVIYSHNKELMKNFRHHRRLSWSDVWRHGRYEEQDGL